MKKLLLLFILFAVTASVAPAATLVEMKTSMGTIQLELDEEKAPISVKNFLAYVDHLAKWNENNLDSETGLAQAFGDRGLPHDLERSKHVAIWAYQQGEAAGARVWYEADKFVELGPEWKQIFAD